jgi:hypothetical protein
MPAPRPWIVTPHTPLEKHEDNLWTVDAEMPGFPALRRRMTIVRRDDGTLVFHNAVPVNDTSLGEIGAWGKPSLLIVPHGYHKTDAQAFKTKLGVKVTGPSESATLIRKVVALDSTFEDFPSDETIRLERLEGIKVLGEAAFLVSTGSKRSLILCDAVGNMPPGRGRGAGELLLWLLGFAGGPKVAPVYRLRFVSDKKALRYSLERLAATPGLCRLVPSHGPVIEGDAAATLRRVAALL